MKSAYHLKLRRLLQTGWVGDERVRGIAICVRLKNQKIWIEEDNTETGIANDLLEKGVPKSDIVLAFHSPKTRKLTGLASA
ncbi:element excision factor XisI family protein [Geitlerinema sp. CS-897]|nr:element excision factor XisI family protein [Geitlerinema sp. CS-897]